MAKRKARLKNLADRDPVITGVAVEFLLGGEVEHAAAGGPVLVIDDDTDLVANALTEDGVAILRWNRRALDGRSASAWPVEQQAGAAVLRLSKDWASFDFALHAVAGLLPPGAKLWVYGANDEGIRSAPRRLTERFFSDVETRHLKRRARVLECTRNDVTEGRKTSLDSFRTASVVGLPLAGGVHEVELQSYPGAFARGHLDSGTEILLRGCAELKPRKKVLDFCAGIGVVGAWVAARWPEAELTLLEVDAPSLEAAKLNLPKARAVLSDGWRGIAPTQRYDAILSNPPLHRGTEEDMSLLTSLVREAPTHLTASGVLVCVCQRSVGATALFQQSFKQVRVLLETNSFQVLCGSAGFRVNPERSPRPLPSSA